MKQTLNLFEKHIQERQIDRHRALDVLLDFLIDMFDVNHFKNEGFENYCIKLQSENPYLFEIALIWMDKVADAMEKGGWLDFFGGLYEAVYQSKGKASALGQFYTPAHLCDLMAKVVSPMDGKVSDCSCGSGRTLVAHFAHSRYNGKNYYIGEDIDTTSVKMCALNMMIHGMKGRVIRHDTLLDPIHFEYGFEINEIRYPFPTPYYSLRKIRYVRK